MWPKIRAWKWVPKGVSASISGAAYDARTWIAVLLLLFIYGMAPEMYQRAMEPKPQLHISIRNINVFEANNASYGKVTGIILEVSIWNTESSTFAVDWRLTATRTEKGRVSAAGPFDLSSMSSEQGLDRRTENISVNDRPVTGKVLFYFRADALSRSALLDPRAEIALSVKDAYGNITEDNELTARWLQ